MSRAGQYTFQIFAAGATLATVFFLGWAVGTLADPKANEPGPQTHTDLEWSKEVCRYGTEQFYIARGIAYREAVDKAETDCLVLLRDNGQDWFQTFYSPETAPR